MRSALIYVCSYYHAEKDAASISETIKLQFNNQVRYN